MSASSFYLYHYANKNVRKAKNPMQGVQTKEFFSNFANFCEIKISKFCLSFPELPKMRNDFEDVASKTGNSKLVLDFIADKWDIIKAL